MIEDVDLLTRIQNNLADAYTSVVILLGDCADEIALLLDGLTA